MRNSGSESFRTQLLNAGSMGGDIHRASRAKHITASWLPAICRSLADDYWNLWPPSLVTTTCSCRSLAGERSTQGRGQTLETLHAIYGRSILPTLESHIHSGRLKIADSA